MKDNKRFLAFFIVFCLACTCVMPTWAQTDYSESEQTERLTDEYPDYIEGNVIVCVRGGAAALDAAMSGASRESRQRGMLKKSVWEFTIDEVLASFDTTAGPETVTEAEHETVTEAEPETEPEAEPETEPETESREEPVRPKLFSALQAAATSAADSAADSAAVPANLADEQTKEEILLLHADDTEALIAKLEELPCVIYAQPDYIYEPETLDCGKKEPFYFAQNNLENADGGCDIDASEAWEVTASAGLKTQVVAIMDSGVNYNHPDLKDIMWNEGLRYPTLTALGGGAYGINTSGEGDTDDPNDYFVGHGTHCASVIASAWNEEGTAGICGNGKIRIMACCWMGKTGGNTSAYVKAVNYVIKAKEDGVNVTVANNSWGSNARFIYRNPVENDLAVRMGEIGIANVFAAGNESTNIDSNQQNTHIRTDTTLIVGAADSEGECAVFSNYGKKNVDVFAPGVHILAAASLNPEIMSVSPQYLPWLKNSESIIFCDMENEDKICINAGASEDVIYPDGDTPEEASPENADCGEASPGNADCGKASPGNADCGEASPGNAEQEAPGILPEIATASITTKRMYGADANHVIAFDMEYVPGEKNGFDVEIQLTDEQAEEAAGAGTVYIAFQIARNGNMPKTEAISTQPKIWNSVSGEFEDVGNPILIFTDPQWNPVSFSFSTKKYPEFIDEEGRIRLRFLDEAATKKSEKGTIYIDNAGMALQPSEYAYESGTSMACPNAAAVLAMIIGKLQAENSERTGVEIIKEAIAYVKGGAVKNDALLGKCITGGVINAARSLKGEVSPVVDNIEDQGNGTSLISGYFFGDKAGKVTIEGTETKVLSWSDRAIQIENAGIERSRAEVIVKSRSEYSGRGYFDYGETSEGYEALAPFPVIAADAKMCAAGDTILCFTSEDDDSGGNVVRVWKYNPDSDAWGRVEVPGGDVKNYLGTSYEVAVAAGETEIYFMSATYEEDPEKPGAVIDKGRLLTYDTLADTWKYDVKVDVQSCSSGTMCIYNGELLLFGVEEEKPLVRKIYPDTGEVYETAEGVPSAYCSGYSFQVGEDILAAGMVNGRLLISLDALLRGIGQFTETLRYENKTGSWKESEALFFGDDSEWLDKDSWRQSSAVPLKDGLMIVGPVKNNGERNMTDTWIYKASEDTYEAYPAAFNTMRTKNAASCLLDGKMYVLGITSQEEANGNMRFLMLDISEIAADAYPDAKKSPKKPDPEPSRKSNDYDPLWNGKPVKTGTPDDPVTGGVWTMDYSGVWYYHTNAYFRNTWGYVVNPYAKENQHKTDWFWFDTNGKMLTGWQFIDGKWYYLNPNRDCTYGACFIGPGRTPDGYEVDETGAWTGRTFRPSAEQ